MEEKEFKQLSEDIYKRIINAFEEIDPDDAEADFHLDNVTIKFGNGVKFIINRQNPVRQIWLATKKEGLHFSFDGSKRQWICNKTGEELFDVLSRNCSELLTYKINV